MELLKNYGNLCLMGHLQNTSAEVRIFIPLKEPQEVAIQFSMITFPILASTWWEKMVSILTTTFTDSWLCEHMIVTSIKSRKVQKECVVEAVPVVLHGFFSWDHIWKYPNL